MSNQPKPVQIEQKPEPLKRMGMIAFPKSVIDAAKIKPWVEKDDISTCLEHGAWTANPTGSDGLRRYQTTCPKCAAQASVNSLLSQAAIPPRFANCHFENYIAKTDAQKSALANSRAYADDFESMLAKGSCRMFLGNPGTGKNHLATAILRSVMQSGHTAKRVKAGEFLDIFWSKGFEERGPWLEKLSQVDLLLLDEIGRSSQAKPAQDAFFRLLDMRYEAMKPMVVTSNLDKDGLIEVLGAAGYDRLRENGGQIVRFTWDTHRGAA